MFSPSRWPIVGETTDGDGEEAPLLTMKLGGGGRVRDESHGCQLVPGQAAGGGSVQELCPPGTGCRPPAQVCPVPADGDAHRGNGPVRHHRTPHQGPRPRPGR